MNICVIKRPPHAGCLSQTPQTANEVPNSNHNHPTQTANHMLGERSLHSESANMADDELVAAITFGLTYFYYKIKQEKEKSFFFSSDVYGT